MILSTHGIVGSQIVQFVGLLDDYSGAAAAYSLRLLRADYTGDAIKVRRSVGTPAETDIGFVNGELDVTTLESFCSGTNGFVTTWYDQSGNGYDATQGTDAKQPQIVSSGSVITENGKPAIDFDGSDDILFYNSLVYTTNTVFANVVITIDSPIDFAVIASQNSSGTNRSSVVCLDNSTPKKSLYFFNNGTSYLNKSSGTITNLQQTLITNYSFSNNYFNALDGGAGNNDVSGQSFTPVSAFGFAIGGQPTDSFFIKGKIQEINIWNSDESGNKTGIETNINDFYSIY